jgi:hypothetical protein
MSKLTVLNYKGDQQLASWIALESAEFLAATEIMKQKIREGHTLIDVEKEEVVKELGMGEEYMLIPQIQGG